MTPDPPPLSAPQPRSIWRRIPWLFLVAGPITAVNLLWCWACFTDEEGPGNGMAAMFWLIIQAVLVFAASLVTLLGLFVAKERPRWLGWLLLGAAWVPVYFWWKSGSLPFLRH